MAVTDEFRNRTVLVTGGSRGIGLAVAREFAARGAGLILVHRVASAEAEALLEEVRADGRPAISELIDLARHEAAQDAMRNLIDQAPPVDVLVNNAGWIQVRPFLDISLAEWHRHIDINLTSMFVVTQTVLPGMLNRGEGRIINISSELGLVG